ncbi:MAG: phosphatase domain-containing protein, partial [Planctomycetota bacterium]
RMLRNAMDVTPEEADCDLFRTRVAPFMAEAGGKLPIRVEFGQHRIQLKKKTKRNGRFATLVSLPDEEIRNIAESGSSGKRFIRYRVFTDHPGSEPVEGRVHLLSDNGISVISDIDDTIKVTSVGNKRELLCNTFLREFQSVSGMPMLYSDWSNQGVDFHYVSSSPWQLYEPLAGMQQKEGFPAGTLHLRNYRISDQLLKRMPVFRRRGKVITIRRLFKHLPQRKFILIGDSGEKDLEIYLKASRQRPSQIAGVFIRDLECKPLPAERIRKFNRRLDLVDCRTFRSAEELRELARPLIEGSLQSV